MYLPASNDERDRARQVDLMRRHPFATLVTPTADGLRVSHVPLLVRERDGVITLAGHLARANDHWRALAEGGPTTAIFQGPHAYVSPAWYATSPAVPTWNYAVVHATGPARVEESAAAIEAHVGELAACFERGDGGWSVSSIPAELMQRLTRAIVGFELRAERIEAKLKLGQNRSAADRAGAIARLEADGDDAARALAAMMRATLPPFEPST